MSEHLSFEAFLKEELSAEESAHLQSCDQCRQLKSDFTLLSTELAQLSDEVEFSEDFKMKKLIKSEAKRIRLEVFKRRLVRSILPLAAVFVFGLVIFNQRAPQVEDQAVLPPAQEKELQTEATTQEIEEKSSTKKKYHAKTLKRRALKAERNLDVVDALRLAQLIDANQVRSELQYDFNQNGVLEKSDLSELRSRIVALRGVQQ